VTGFRAYGSNADIICQLWMSENVHFLMTPACLPKLLVGKTLDFAGLEFLLALHDFLITDVMWLRI